MHMLIDGDTMVARLDPHVKVRVGDVIDFTVRMTSVHIFDKDTGDTVF